MTEPHQHVWVTEEELICRHRTPAQEMKTADINEVPLVATLTVKKCKCGEKWIYDYKVDKTA